MDISVAWSILNQKRSKDVCDYHIHNLQDGRNIVVVIHFYDSRAIVLLYDDHQDTKYESWEIENIISGPRFAQKRTSETPCHNHINILLHGKENIVVVINTYGSKAIILIFGDHQDTKSE